MGLAFDLAHEPPHDRALASNHAAQRLSLGWATAWCCTLVSATTRCKSCGCIRSSCTATLMVQRQQLLHPFFAQQPTTLDEGGGVAGQAVLKVRLAREVLPRRCLAAALQHPFIGLVEGVLQVQQADHDAHWHARAPGSTDPWVANWNDIVYHCTPIAHGDIVPCDVLRPV